MFARHATNKAAGAVSELEREVAAAVKRIQHGRFPDVSDLKFLADRRITNEMYLKYRVEEVCRDVLGRNHEDNMGVSNWTHEILARITKPTWLAKSRREEPQKMSAAKRDAIMMKEMMKKYKEREVEEEDQEERDAEKPKMEETKKKPTITNAERRRRVLERMTREAEQREESYRKRKMEQRQDETVKKPRIEVITID